MNSQFLIKFALETRVSLLQNTLSSYKWSFIPLTIGLLQNCQINTTPLAVKPQNQSLSIH